jgi:hypothetical protein
MQVSVDRFQAESGSCRFLMTASKQSQDGTSWFCLEAVNRNLHETYQCRMYSRTLLMMDREMPETCRVLKQNKIGIISASGWLFKKKSITMHGNMNVKLHIKHLWNTVYVDLSAAVTLVSVTNMKMQNLISLYYILCCCVCWQPWPEVISANFEQHSSDVSCLTQEEKWSRLSKKVRIRILMFTLISFMQW